MVIDTRFHILIHYDSLLQNATDIITKCDRSLLQNVSGFLLQNATVLLQNATVIAKCDVHYKLQQYRLPPKIIKYRNYKGFHEKTCHENIFFCHALD